MTPLNVAADTLIQALEGTADLAGLRQGLHGSIGFWSALTNADNDDHQNALDLIAVWQSLDALAEAVQTRREQG